MLIGQEAGSPKQPLKPEIKYTEELYYPDVYLQLIMFRAFSRPSSGALDCCSSLWYYLRIVVIAVLRSWSGRLWFI